MPSASLDDLGSAGRQTVVAHDKAGILLLDRPGRREAALSQDPNDPLATDRHLALLFAFVSLAPVLPQAMSMSGPKLIGRLGHLKRRR